MQAQGLMHFAEACTSEAQEHLYSGERGLLTYVCMCVYLLYVGEDEGDEGDDA